MVKTTKPTSSGSSSRTSSTGHRPSPTVSITAATTWVSESESNWRRHRVAAAAVNRAAPRVITSVPTSADAVTPSSAPNANVPGAK